MRIVVIQGGPSTEAEVSRASGAAVGQALIAAGHEVAHLELGPDLSSSLLREAPEVVFPVTHGALGEDGCLQGFLEVSGIPYVGSGVRASALAADKVSSKIFFARAGLPLAGQVVAQKSQPPTLHDLRAILGPELIVKPSAGGSTIGISRLLVDAGDKELAHALAIAHELDQQALVETYVRGEELTCAVLEGDDGPVALPPTLIKARATDWYDFESKYQAGGSEHVCPAPFAESVIKRIQAEAVAAHLALGARDLSRTDLIMSADGSLIVLELNTLPGMTEVSLFPEAARAAGLSFEALVDSLVKRAAARKGAYGDSKGASKSGKALPRPKGS